MECAETTFWAIFADNAVAGNDNSQAVVAAGIPNGLRSVPVVLVFFVFAPVNAGGDFAVSAEIPIGNLENGFPSFPLVPFAFGRRRCATKRQTAKTSGFRIFRGFQVGAESASHLGSQMVLRGKCAFLRLEVMDGGNFILTALHSQAHRKR